MTFPSVYYHHIGGRDGKFPIELSLLLKSSVSLTLYDADKSCIEDINNKIAKEEFAEIKVLPYCLAGKEGKADFIITKQPTNSSLLAANPEVYSYIRNSPKFGSMRLGEMLSAHFVENIGTTLFSTVIHNEKNPQPDFISLDIQGAEYDVIFTSQNIFQEALLISVEVGFVPMYKDQKLFPELHHLMMKLGFVLVDLKPYDPHHLCRTPLDFDGKGFLLDGEAFYIKKPDLWNWTFEKLLKYCFAAILCCQTHLCIEVFEVFAKNFSEEINSFKSGPSYIMLVKELFEAYSKAQKHYLPFFQDSKTYQNYHRQNKCEPIIMGYKEKIDEKEMTIKNGYVEVLKKYGLDSFAQSIEIKKQTNINSLNNMRFEFCN